MLAARSEYVQPRTAARSVAQTPICGRRRRPAKHDRSMAFLPSWSPRSWRRPPTRQDSVDYPKTKNKSKNFALRSDELPPSEGGQRLQKARLNKRVFTQIKPRVVSAHARRSNQSCVLVVAAWSARASL